MRLLFSMCSMPETNAFLGVTCATVFAIEEEYCCIWTASPLFFNSLGFHRVRTLPFARIFSVGRAFGGFFVSLKIIISPEVFVSLEIIVSVELIDGVCHVHQRCWLSWWPKQHITSEERDDSTG